ncbi:MAG TPA: hypothetical protein VFE17_07025 [Candidatus Baltobacteraceae bacterium]|jgi:hypothetical protein|nr:hypothetical protein [Candidatus Baltobacteraceae bacterium]
MRDQSDTRRVQRNAVSFLASLLLHAIAAYLLFSLATSSSEQARLEAIPGNVVVTVTRQAPKVRTPAKPTPVTVPVPHAPVVPHPRAAAQPRSAPPHPRVLHELAKTAPSAPPNPTPAPVSSSLPNPVPTQAQLSVTPAPIPAAVPTSAPAQILAAAVPTAVPSRRPATPAPTAAPQTPVPSAAPRTASPSAPPATPQPQPSAIEATQAPLQNISSPEPLVTPGAPAHVRIAQAAPSPAAGAARSPGPRTTSSPGPRGQAQRKSTLTARPIQPLPATPRPVSAPASRASRSLNERLRSLIPTSAPSSTPAPGKHYSFVNLKFTPPPEPTPPPSVLAATKFVYTENVGSQHWKHWPLGAAPEEVAVRMYVTSVRHIGPIAWCTGWVARLPEPGSREGYLVNSDRDLTPKWIIEENESLLCAGKLTPFTQPASEPTKAP